VTREEDAPGLLLTVLPGIPLRESALPAEQALRAYRAAGRLARRLHDLDRGDWFGVPDAAGNPLAGAERDPVAFMAGLVSRWFDKARSQRSLTEREQRLGTWAVQHAQAFAGEPPVPINNDYTPGNWLVSDSGDLTGVIDFENMGWWLPMDSFGRLLLREFRSVPRAREAFFGGYGRDAVAEQPVQARVVVIRWAIFYIAYGTERGNDGYVRLGRETLHRCGEES
jgi:aminoglycoside phosphotransferase (APT) family kinase protein